MLKSPSASSSSSTALTPASTPGSCDSNSKSNRKYWGEECLSDAIYNVYLKKITYSTTTSLVPTALFPEFGVSSISSGSSENDLVDSLHKVFRRRSSFDKGFRDLKKSPKRNIRSASVSALLGHQQQQHQHQNHNLKSSTEFLNGSLLSQEYNDSSRIKIKNYQKLNNDADSLQSIRTSSSSPGHRTSSPADQQETSSLQWETRQIRILKAGTINHIVKYILFLTQRQRELEPKQEEQVDTNGTDGGDHCHSVVMEEERNNVSHVIHVFFTSYRLFTSPSHLFQLIQQTFAAHVKSQQQQQQERHEKSKRLSKQLNFLLLYWLNNYPEDFLSDPCEPRSRILHPLVKNPPNANSVIAAAVEPSQASPPSPSPPSPSLGNCVQSEDSSSIKSKESSERKECESLLPDKEGVGSCGSGGSQRSSISSSARSDKGSKGSKGSNRSSRRSAGSCSNDGRSLEKAVTASIVSDSDIDRSAKPKLIDALLSVSDLDESIHRKALVLLQDFKPDSFASDGSDNGLNGSSKNFTAGPCTSILDLDARFIAQQLTAIDLESFLSLKPYFLLEGTRSNDKVQATIKNFNLLSRQVILTILKSNAPDIVTGHWIEVALHLRRMKNFNSLKAVIAGLTNESIYRLRNMVWSKLGRTTSSNFKLLSSIVDDVNNQSVLRQTQLDMEGTAKVCLQEDYSFGTIPYLGTFFTDLTFIDTRYPSTIQSKSGDEKMINLEKCSKQFEVLTQVQLLQKNLRASLSAYNQSQNMNATVFMNSSATAVSSLLIGPRVARIFRNWFSEESSCTLTDGDCYKLSLALEPPANAKK